MACVGKCVPDVCVAGRTFLLLAFQFRQNWYRGRLTLHLKNTTNRRIAVWFFLSLLYAAICAGLALHQAFGSEYVLADDVRQHVFWMFRFVELELS